MLHVCRNKHSACANTLHACRSKLRDCSGTTIVSVLVAFVVLLLGVAMLMGSLQLAQQATVRAEQLRRETNTLLEEYYVNDAEQPPDTVGREGESFTLTDGESSFTLKLTQQVYTVDGNSLYAFGE